MRVARNVRLGVTLSAIACLSGTARAEPLHHWSGARIRAQFTGKMLTDGTHWRETYQPRGKLLIEEMGHEAATGSWHIDGDRLCKLRPGILNDRYEVWGAQYRVELRFGSYPPLEAFLHAPGSK